MALYDKHTSINVTVPVNWQSTSANLNRQTVMHFSKLLTNIYIKPTVILKAMWFPHPFQKWHREISLVCQPIHLHYISRIRAKPTLWYSPPNVIIEDKNSLHCLNISGIVTEVVPLCSVYHASSYKPITFLCLPGFHGSWLIWACYLFLTWTALPAHFTLLGMVFLARFNYRATSYGRYGKVNDHNPLPILVRLRHNPLVQCPSLVFIDLV